ncbi:Spidroin-1 [Araneus ventricosus]|uniref:Spidroin-1 n=1 Tax=Araneus ventricosus TaxID=182803 RepID=A0A4Y2EIN4_ARAVE|nr:Spidroin-1 [Araneus ventricosus]
MTLVLRSQAQWGLEVLGPGKQCTRNAKYRSPQGPTGPGPQGPTLSSFTFSGPGPQGPSGPSPLRPSPQGPTGPGPQGPGSSSSVITSYGPGPQGPSGPGPQGPSPQGPTGPGPQGPGSSSSVITSYGPGPQGPSGPGPQGPSPQGPTGPGPQGPSLSSFAFSGPGPQGPSGPSSQGPSSGYGRGQQYGQSVVISSASSRLSSPSATSRISSAVSSLMTSGPRNPVGLSIALGNILSQIQSSNPGLSGCESLVQALLEIASALIQILSVSSVGQVDFRAIGQSASIVGQALMQNLG